MSKNFIFKKIPPDNINVTTFQIFKNWILNDSDHSSSYSASIYQAITPFNENNFRQDLDYNVQSGQSTNPDGSHQKTHWYGLNQSFYRDLVNTHGTENYSEIKKMLFESASIFSIPQEIFGERIKANSVVITDKSIRSYTGISSTQTIELKDDGNGNLFDTAIASGSFIKQQYLVGYWGFNDHFWHVNKNISKGTIYDNTEFRVPLEYENIKFIPGILTTGQVTESVGHMVEFNTSSRVWKNDFENVNFDGNDDFAISLWTKLPTSQSIVSESVNWLISKQGQIYQLQGDKNSTLRSYEYRNYNTSAVGLRQFPFAIQVYNQSTGSNNGKVRVTRADGEQLIAMTSSLTINDNAFHHICFNKTGSELELWVDGSKNVSGSYTLARNTKNDAIFTVGCNGVTNNTSLSGSIDELRIFSRGLSSAEITSLNNNHFLSGSALNIARIGNVFYRQGIIVVTDPRPKYKQIFAGSFRSIPTGSFNYISGSDSSYYGFELKYRSTVTTTEYEYICQIDQGDFNLTLNPTIRKNKDYNGDEIQDFATGSAFTPYCTSVGLYNSFGELLAIGKLATPLPIRDDVNTNIIVRFDE